MDLNVAFSAMRAEESADEDDLFDKERDALLKNESDDISLGKEKPTEESNRNEIAPLPNSLRVQRWTRILILLV